MEAATGNAVMVHRVVLALTIIRKAWKLTRQEIADRMGTHQETIWRYETDRNDPRISVLERWADTLGYEIVLRPKQDDITKCYSDETGGS